MKKVKNSNLNKFMSVAVAVTLVAGAGIASVTSARYGADAAIAVPEYYYYESEYDSAEAVRKAAVELNKQVEAEGAVLLKNDGLLPLAPKSEGGKVKISVFGKNTATVQTNTAKESIAYFGFGSSDSLAIGGDWSRASIPFYDAFNDTVFELNPTLMDFYNDTSKSGTGRFDNDMHRALDNYRAGLPTGETPQSKYTQAVKDSYTQYNDAALVVLTRVRGEGNDLPKTSLKGWGGEKLDSARNGDDHYLQLDKYEVEMLQAVMNSFENVILLVNASGPMEVGFLDDPTHYLYTDNGYTSSVEEATAKMNRIKAAVSIGFPGTDGVMVVPKILSGEVNPSGRLADTWIYDMKSDPTWQNQGFNGTSDGNKYGESYVHYDEDIYLGYRYYETRYYEEGKTAADDGESWYDEQVQYPFGYGLSYTTFKKEVVSIEAGGNDILGKFGKVTAKVKVTNIGDMPGKEVVQLYYSAPYYAGGISKSHVELAAFEKTQILEPGASEVLTITFDVEDMKSYDWSDANGNGFKGYELEKGDYYIVVADTAHEAAQKAAEALRAVPEPAAEGDTATDGEDGEETTVVAPVKKYTLSADIRYETDTTTGTEVKNLFDYASGTGKTNDPETFAGVRQYMLRDDFEGTFPTAASTKKTGARQEKWEYSVTEDFDRTQPYYSETTPAQASTPGNSVTNKIKLWHLRGRDYDDPLWDAFLDQLTVQELVSQIENGFFGTRPINSVDKPSTYDDDGPLGKRHCPDAQWADNTTLAQTFNKKLAYDVGVMNGEAALWGVNHGEGSNMMAAPGGKWSNTPDGRGGTYGLGLDTHRSPFGGRNFEYFSEDPVLAGKMAANVAKGSLSKGCYQISKHIMLNDQETDRGSLNTWASEQAIREIYGKPFEIAIKEGGLNGLMTGVNRIGNKHCCFNWELLNGLVRNEWGFRGFVITDLVRYDVNMCIRAGCNTMMVHNQYNTPNLDAASLTATHLTAIRESAKSVLYTCANTNGVHGFGGERLSAINYGGVNTLYAVEGVDNDLNVATAENTIAAGSAISYSLAAGSVLPAGMTIDDDGVLSGAPSEAGEYTFTLNADEKLAAVREIAYPYKTAQKTFKLKVYGADEIPNKVIFEDDNIATIPYGFDYEQDIKSAVVFDANGKLTSDVTYALAEGSELPQGLKLENGVIKGVCVAPAGKYFFTVRATAEGRTPQELDFIVSVKQFAIEYESKQLAPFAVGVAANANLADASSNVGYAVTYKLKEGDKLPEGLALSSNGILSGTPVRGCTDHEFTVVASAELSKPKEVTYKITVKGLEMSDMFVGDMLLGKNYKVSLGAAANDKDVSSITYSLADGSELPQGFALSSDGLLVGKPVETGKQSFVVRVSADGYKAIEATVTIDVYDIYEDEVTGEIDADPMPEKPVFYLPAENNGNALGVTLGIVIPVIVLGGAAAAIFLLKKKGILFAGNKNGKTSDGNTPDYTAPVDDVYEVENAPDVDATEETAPNGDEE